MKKLLMGSIVLTLFSMSIIFVQLSCTKDTTAQSTVKTDTVIVYKCDTLTKEQLLVAKTWRVDMVYEAIGGVFSKYVLGGTNTTGVNYDNTRFLFKADGTGTYTNESGVDHSLTWQFTTSDKRTMQVNTTSVNNSTWEMVEISGNYLHFSVNFSLSGNSNNMESFRLKQVP